MEIKYKPIVRGFTTNETKSESQQMYGTQESHVWEMMQTSSASVVTLNKKTGEIRFVKTSGYEVIRQK